MEKNIENDEFLRLPSLRPAIINSNISDVTLIKVNNFLNFS